MFRDRVLGLLAQSMGDLDQAASHFEDAVEFCRESGYRPQLAWSCDDHAELLLERNADEDRTTARDLVEESLAISTELGMRLFMGRVTALQVQLESLPVQTPAYPAGLTRREVGVLQIVCRGKTDREIGEELFISVSTVGNILNKTGAVNRAGAASYANRHGLVTADPAQ